jgi:hypothetical protein
LRPPPRHCRTEKLRDGIEGSCELAGSARSGLVQQQQGVAVGPAVCASRKKARAVRHPCHGTEIAVVGSRRICRKQVLERRGAVDIDCPAVRVPYRHAIPGGMDGNAYRMPASSGRY